MNGRRAQDGFSLVELMIVVMIVGVLVAIALPMFVQESERAAQKTCYANQRMIEGVAQSYSADHDEQIADLEGVVTAGHPLVEDYIFRAPPSCPSAPSPAEQATVDVAHGAYTLDAEGTVAPCAFGDPVHGSF